MTNRAEILKQQFLGSLGLPWQEILPESHIQAILEEEGIVYYNSVYTPIVTLWAMISQVLDPDKSLSQAVKRMSLWLESAGKIPPSSDTGAYSKARSRLPEVLLQQLIPDVAAALEAQVSPENQWCGRSVRVCDGTTLLVSDTPANQAEYPQHGNQKKGCGFPMVKLVVIFSLMTGAVVAASISAFKTSELFLSRLLYGQLQPDDVLLADRAYGNYVDLALVQQAEADGVFRKHYARKTDFRSGQRLGKGDHLVVWDKPKQCPENMDVETFESLPEQLTVREVKIILARPGYRRKVIILVTTLLDAKRYSKQALCELYGLRWQAAEVNLRHLKTTLKMERLTAKSPQMVRKEIWTHLLAYNLLRTVMWQGMVKSDKTIFHISFQETRQALNLLLPFLVMATKTNRKQLYQSLLKQVMAFLLPLRPGRSEPRVVKQRPKPFPRMNKPRSVLKAALAR